MRILWLTVWNYCLITYWLIYWVFEHQSNPVDPSVLHYPIRSIPMLYWIPCPPLHVQCMLDKFWKKSWCFNGFSSQQAVNNFSFMILLFVSHSYSIIFSMFFQAFLLRRNSGLPRKCLEICSKTMEKTSCPFLIYSIDLLQNILFSYTRSWTFHICVKGTFYLKL